MQLDKLTFFKRQSHLLMDEPQIVILKHGLSLNSAFSKKITQSGYKRCKLALDVKDNDYSKANNLYIILTNEKIENGVIFYPSLILKETWVRLDTLLHAKNSLIEFLDLMLCDALLVVLKEGCLLNSYKRISFK